MIVGHRAILCGKNRCRMCLVNGVVFCDNTQGGVNGMNCYPIEIDQRFGVFQGSMPCVFIKTGNGGTIYGEGGKYLSIAEKIHDETGRFVCLCGCEPC